MGGGRGSRWLNRWPAEMMFSFSEKLEIKKKEWNDGISLALLTSSLANIRLGLSVIRVIY